MSKQEPVILAVDLGTSSMKVAAISPTGQVLGWEAETIQLYVTQDGGVEQDPEEWWQAFLLTTRRLLSNGKVQAKDVIAVCCSTQGEGTIPVDRQGNTLMRCIMWMDMRGQADLLRQFKGVLNLNGVALSKVLRWVRLTGGMPSICGKDPAAHMLYVRNHFPEVYERTFKFLNVLDYLNFRLTGRFCATYDSILTSWVTDNRDPDGIHYHSGLVKDSGIETEKFPEIVKCSEVIGTVSTGTAAALGLSPQVRVVAGAIDTTAAAIGAGTVADNQLHLYVGTSSWMAAHVPYKKTDIGSSMASLPCAIPGKYLLVALQATAGGNLNFLRDRILYNKDELLQEAAVPDIFKYLDQIADRVPPGANGVLYTPWIWGERAPVEDRKLRAGLYNLSLHNSREDIIRAFLEGIALNTRWLLRPVEKFLGHSVGEIHIVGGGAQSEVWCQIFADVMNRRIIQVSDPVYANARGAAWIGAVGIGQIGFPDITGLIQVRRAFEPQTHVRALYDEKFAVFMSVYGQMRHVYHRMNRQLG